MFKFNPSRKFEMVDVNRLMRFATSVNEPQIASASHGMQCARAYVAALKEEKGADVFIAFFFPDVKDIEYYTLPGIVAEAHVEKAFEKAVDFCASMGFVMEEITLEETPTQLQEQLKEVSPLFYPSIEEYSFEDEEEELELEETVSGEDEVELEEVAEEEETEEIELEEVAEEEAVKIELEEEGDDVEIELEEEIPGKGGETPETEGAASDGEREGETETGAGSQKEKLRQGDTDGEITLRHLLEKYKLIKDEGEDE